MYVCLCIHTYIQACIYTYTYTYKPVCTHTCMYVYTYVCVHTCVHIYVCVYVHVYIQASLVAQTVKNLPAIQETWVQSLVWKDPLEKEVIPTPIVLPKESHGPRRLVGYSP